MKDSRLWACHPLFSPVSRPNLPAEPSAMPAQSSMWTPAPLPTGKATWASLPKFTPFFHSSRAPRMSWNRALPNCLPQFRGSFHLTHRHDGQALPDGYVHFGYRDGLSQPFLAGGPKPARPYPDLGVNKDGSSPAGDFLLGFENTFNNKYSPGVADTPLGRNGSFGAFRILKQEVAEFEEFLQTAAPTIGPHPRPTRGQASGPLAKWCAACSFPDGHVPHSVRSPEHVPVRRHGAGSV